MNPIIKMKLCIIKGKQYCRKEKYVKRNILTAPDNCAFCLLQGAGVGQVW